MCPWPSSQLHSFSLHVFNVISLPSLHEVIFNQISDITLFSLSESSSASRFLPWQQLVLALRPWVSETIGPENFTALWNSSSGDQGLHFFFPGSFQLSTFSLSSLRLPPFVPAPALLNFSPASFLGGK